MNLAADCPSEALRPIPSEPFWDVAAKTRTHRNQGLSAMVFHILECGKYACSMQFNPQDLVVALKLALRPGLTFQKLADSLALSVSAVHRSVTRAKAAGLLLANRQPNRYALLEFVLHGARYAFPAVRGRMTRGMPTAYAAPPLSELIQPGDDPIPVWPDAEGEARGELFKPLHRCAPAAARADPKLYECLSLIDALRGGRARERNLAKEHLTRLING